MFSEFEKTVLKFLQLKCHAKFKFLSQVSHKQGHPHPLMQILIDAAQ
jgi:hypothetical protein